MLDSLFASVMEDTITFSGTMKILLTALALGVIISLIYVFTHRKEGVSTGFAITLTMLPAIVASIIFLVGNSVAKAFSLAGAFALVRFRSEPGGPKSIAYIFLEVACGLACGMGRIGYAVLFVVVMGALMLVLNAIHFAQPKSDAMRLKITVPEDMNYPGVFDEVLGRYTTAYQLKRVKTCDFGTLFELVYNIRVRTDADQKKFLDELRTLNGNLGITLSLAETADSMAA
nr:DUF4956 domain-containing protein [bacterium]